MKLASSILAMTCAGLLSACASSLAPASLMNKQEIRLWQGTPPGSANVKLVEKSTDGSKDPADPQRTLSKIDTPTLTVYTPAKTNGVAAVITVGGGYTSLVIDKEGTDIAKWLNTLGITAFVIKNRLPGEGHQNGKDVPLQDGQRAIRLVRANAEKWGINPQKIGIIGLSSGGHMASMIGTSYSKQVYAPVDAADQVSARPDFMVLAYGPHSGNARQFLIDPLQAPLLPPEKQALYDEYPSDQQITKQTAPAFIVSADNDDKVNPLNSVRFYQGLKRAGIPAELHIFKDGKHGFAIRNAVGYPIAIWTQLCETWMRTSGILPKP